MRSSSKTASLALVIGALAFSGCASNNRGATGPLRVEDYSPLGLGYTWNYSVRFFSQTGERKVKIVSKQKGYFLDSLGGALQHTAHGLRDRDRYLIKGPLKEGAKWKAVLSASAVEHYEIVSLGEACEAKAGRFDNCLVIQGRVRQDAKVTLHSRFVWAKDVGLVKIITDAEFAGKEGLSRQTEQSLINYNFTEEVTPKAEPKAPAKAQKASSDEAPDSWSR